MPRTYCLIRNDLMWHFLHFRKARHSSSRPVTSVYAYLFLSRTHYYPPYLIGPLSLVYLFTLWSQTVSHPNPWEATSSPVYPEKSFGRPLMPKCLRKTLESLTKNKTHKQFNVILCNFSLSGPHATFAVYVPDRFVSYHFEFIHYFEVNLYFHHHMVGS